MNSSAIDRLIDPKSLTWFFIDKISNSSSSESSWRIESKFFVRSTEKNLASRPFRCLIISFASVQIVNFDKYYIYKCKFFIPGSLNCFKNMLRFIFRFGFNKFGRSRDSHFRSVKLAAFLSENCSSISVYRDSGFLKKKFWEDQILNKCVYINKKDSLFRMILLVLIIKFKNALEP